MKLVTFCAVAIFGGISFAMTAQCVIDKVLAEPDVVRESVAPVKVAPVETPAQLHQRAVKLSRWAAYASLRAGWYEARARNAERNMLAMEEGR